MNGTDPDDVSPTAAIGGGLIILTPIAVIVTALFLPSIQSFFYWLLIAHPSIIQWTLIAGCLFAVGLYLDNEKIGVAAFIVFFAIALLIGPLAGGIYAHTDMANQMQNDATNLETLPNTSNDSPRILPRSIADNYADSSIQFPQYQLTESDIAYHGDEYTWSYGVEPDAFFVKWFGTQRGALYVNMTTIEKDIEIQEAEFQHGRGQIWFDSHEYRSVFHNPTTQHNWDTVFNARAPDGTPYIAHATTTYDWRFRVFPLPQLYAVPVHDSVQVMYQNGSIESYTPNEAQNQALLRGQNYYPYNIAMFKVDSMRYRHGALNAWFWKEDVLSIADLPEGGNQWPLTVPTGGDGLTYFVATEPAGSGNGVYEVWTFDAQTGDAGVQQYDDAQIGPQRAVDFVERQPNVNRLSSANAVAPIPVVSGDDLYWHVKVVPESRTGVIYTAFVNAGTGNVTLIEGTGDVYRFLSREEYRSLNRTQSGESGGESLVEVSVVIVDSDGSIVRVENVSVPENGSVRVEVNEAG